MFLGVILGAGFVHMLFGFEAKTRIGIGGIESFRFGTLIRVGLESLATDTIRFGVENPATQIWVSRQPCNSDLGRLHTFNPATLTWGRNSRTSDLGQQVLPIRFWPRTVR